MSNSDILYLFTILEAIQKAKIYIKDIVNSDDFYQKNDQMIFNATITLLIAIGEESKKLSELKKAMFTEINWDAIVGLRNIAAHNYRGIDPDLIWDSVVNNLPTLETACLNILYEYAHENLENRTDILDFIENPYYKQLKDIIKL